MIFFIKKVKKEISDRNKNIFQKAKKLFDLRVEVYKKLALEEDLKFEKSFGETVKLKNQKDNLSETPEQKNFIECIEDKSKTVNYNLFKEYFNVATPTFLAKQSFKIKNKNKNSEFVKLTKVKWSNLKDEI